MHWLRRRIHPVWQVAALSYGVVLGVALAQWWRVENPWALCILGVVFAILAVWRQRRILLVFALVAGLCFGLARGAGDQRELTLYKSIYNQQVTLTGTVRDDADATNSSTRVQIKNIKLGEQDLPGQVWVSLVRARDVQRGDVIVVQGTLREGFGNFVASLPSATLQQISRVPSGDPALEVRDSFAESVRRAISEPAASLGVGYLLGKKSALPEQLLEALKITGLTHIIVASGYNLTILVRLARRLFAKISKFLAAFVSGGLIFGFIAMTGLSPSMTRAGLVTGLSLLAWYYGRNFHPIVLLGIALAATTLWQPSYAWGDVGWQLSFAAFAGVMIVAPIMSAYFFGKQRAPAVGQILLETLAAQLVTAPIIMMIFGQISVIALMSNLLIAPFIPLAMALTTVAGLGGFLPAAALIFGWPAQQLLNAMIAVVYWCADQPWAQAQQQLTWWGALIWYGTLFAIVFYMKRRSKFSLRTASVVA